MVQGAGVRPGTYAPGRLRRGQGAPFVRGVPSNRGSRGERPRRRIRLGIETLRPETPALFDRAVRGARLPPATEDDPATAWIAERQRRWEALESWFAPYPAARPRVGRDGRPGSNGDRWGAVEPVALATDGSVRLSSLAELGDAEFAELFGLLSRCWRWDHGPSAPMGMTAMPSGRT
jgi:hypothetical protein